MTSVLWILALLAAAGVSAFAVQNAQPVEMRFLGWHTAATLPVVIFISAALGAVLAGVLAGVPLVRARQIVRRQSEEIAQLQAAATVRPSAAADPVSPHEPSPEHQPPPAHEPPSAGEQPAP